jgi:hypothetical protein
MLRTADRLAVGMSEIPRLSNLNEAAHKDSLELLREQTALPTGAPRASRLDHWDKPRPIRPMTALVLREPTATPLSRHHGVQGEKSHCGGGSGLSNQKSAAF